MRMKWLRRRTRARDASGFTLLEVVIAMAILSVGLLSIAAAQLAALHMSSRSKNLTTAMHLAEQKMEEFQGLPTASLPASGADASELPDPLEPIDRPSPTEGLSEWRAMLDATAAAGAGDAEAALAGLRAVLAANPENLEAKRQFVGLLTARGETVSMVVADVIVRVLGTLVHSPVGQRIEIESIDVAEPRPKCTRRLLWLA